MQTSWCSFPAAASAQQVRQRLCHQRQRAHASFEDVQVDEQVLEQHSVSSCSDRMLFLKLL